MNRAELINSLELAFNAAFEGFRSNLWTALPCKITKVNANQTVECQPTIMVNIEDEKGNITPTKLPVLVDVPLHYPRGGDFVLTFPVTVGDECLVVFSSRCIDSWFQSGDIGPQAEVRYHDLSDGFAFVGFSSEPNAITDASQDSVDLRSLDDSTHIKIKNNEIKLKASTIEIEGTLKVSDDILLGPAETSLTTHTHPLPAGGNTGAMNP